VTRWIIILAIAVATWIGLTIYHEGLDRAYGGLFAPREIPSWEPAANRTTPDRPEDAFQRAYNTSEGRVHRAMEKDDPAD
jgi:hypothetical protein